MKFDSGMIMNPAGLLRAFGIFAAVLAAGALINRRRYAKMNNPVGLLMMGSLALVFGLIIVCTWNNWILDWPTLVYACGWLLVVKGLLMILLPGMFANTGQRYGETGWRFAIKAVIALCWGAALVIVSFMYGAPSG